MWAWRPSVHKKYPIRAQLAVVIVGVHLFMLMPCFLLQQGQAPYHIQVNTALMNSNLPVIFVPFQEQSAIVAPIPSKPKSRTQKKKIAAKKQTKTEIKNKTALKTVALKDEKNKSKKVAENLSRHPVRRSLGEEGSSTAATAKASAVAEKSIKQIVPKKLIAKQEKIQEKIETNVAANHADPLRHSIATARALAKAEKVEEQSTQPVEQKEMCVGAADLEQLTMQNAIQSILSVSWQPPVGLPDDVACQISFKVGTTGEIVELAMIKPSGILMYDIAVQNALYESSGRLPRYSYGKEFCITFTQ